jgi:2-keto-4-pentenoate hydratase/2-oxohepta-3-ene-1,7-dioic acid hydratase in catechol pathway
MRFIAFERNDWPALGLRIGDEVVDLTSQGLPPTLDELLRRGAEGFAEAAQVANRSRERLPLSELTYLPPLMAPSKAIAVGLNYADHAAETAQSALPTYPVLFQRYPTSWVAHMQKMIRPAVSEKFDYEAELVVVIGKQVRNVAKSQALDCVAGYSIFNDGSIRDYQFRSSQWMVGKNFDHSAGFGPEFVTADELPSGASGLRIQARLNGKVLQDANTEHMIFDVATLVHTCSEVMTLRPGDIIITGTPGGVGMARRPPVFMRPGDRCEVEVDGIGVLSNEIADEPTMQTALPGTM